ncbi:hypothetical protein DFH11DRAFT_1129260 [Phellopilus nigrolimitatus]|nr:hypothetical protein DFH11DRAFT_1129260 [Phellopilus nigrolimitatus]
MWERAAQPVAHRHRRGEAERGPAIAARRAEDNLHRPGRARAPLYGVPCRMRGRTYVGRRARTCPGAPDALLTIFASRSGLLPARTIGERLGLKFEGACGQGSEEGKEMQPGGARARAGRIYEYVCLGEAGALRGSLSQSGKNQRGSEKERKGEGGGDGTELEARSSSAAQRARALAPL